MKGKRAKKLQILISICLILILTLIAFYPSLKNGFVNWDDDRYLIKNSLIKTLSWSSVKKMFISFDSCNYPPLTILSYAFEYQLFKLNPLGYHITNLFLHLLNCILVFWLIFLLSKKNVSVSLITSILFGIHPLHTESVAWVSGRKDVLYAFLYFGALIAYIYYLYSNKRLKYYILSLMLFILSLLSKPMAITLPLVFFLIDYINNRKYNKPALIEKIPFVILSFVSGIIALFSQLEAVRREHALEFLAKIKIASYGIIFYLGKMFFPLKLSCFYPYPKISDGFMPEVYNFAFLAAIILFIAVCFSLRYTRKIVFGGLFFLLTVFPTLQFVPIGAIIVADRYTYIPSVGIFSIISVIFIRLIKKVARNVYLNATILSVFFLISINFIYLTHQRCRIWENDITLWNDVIKNYGMQYIPIAYYKRGMAYLDRNKQKSAFLDFKNAIELYYGRLELKQDWNGFYQGSLSSGQDYAKVFNLMGIQFAEVSRINEAVILFNKIIEKNPENFDAYLNLCVTYGNLGMYKYAIEYGKKAIELNPKLAAAHFNLAVAYYFDKERGLSLLHLEKAKSLGFNLPEDFLRVLE